MGHRPPLEPNLVQLENALRQTQNANAPNAAQWKHIILERLYDIDCNKLVADVAPFLEHPDESKLITVANIQAALT